MFVQNFHQVYLSFFLSSFPSISPSFSSLFSHLFSHLFSSIFSRSVYHFNKKSSKIVVVLKVMTWMHPFINLFYFIFMIHILWISKETNASSVTNGPFDSVNDKFIQKDRAKNFRLKLCCERFIISSSSSVE